jgi:hypothetical protein
MVATPVPFYIVVNEDEHPVCPRVLTRRPCVWVLEVNFFILLAGRRRKGIRLVLNEAKSEDVRRTATLNL